MSVSSRTQQLHLDGVIVGCNATPKYYELPDTCVIK